MFRSTKARDLSGSKSMTSFSRTKIADPPAVGFAAGADVAAPPPVVDGAGVPLPHAARMSATVVRIASAVRRVGRISPSQQPGVGEHTSVPPREFTLPHRKRTGRPHGRPVASDSGGSATDLRPAKLGPRPSLRGLRPYARRRAPADGAPGRPRVARPRGPAAAPAAL